MQPKVGNDQFSARIAELVNLGYSTHRIAAEVGLSQTAIRHRLKVMSLTTLGKPVSVFRNQEARSRRTTCSYCERSLEGLQTRFCSRRCLEKTHSGNSYEAQKCRANVRKLSLILERGGKCSKCGYAKNVAALCFHHVDPAKKAFPLDSRGLSNHSLESVHEEAAKCALLCANCHFEEHHPELTMTVTPA